MSMTSRKKYKSKEGYISVFMPEHPRPRYGYVLEHILVMEEYLGINLPADCIVHHRDEQRDNNKIENLLLMRNTSDHLMLHNAMRSNKRELVKAYENWSLQFMGNLKAGMKYEEAIKVPFDQPKSFPAPISKPGIILKKKSAG